MRLLIEGYEVVSNPEGVKETEFIRVDVTDMSEKDIQKTIEEIKVLLQDKEHYIIRKHICRHDENKSCDIEIIEEK